MQGNSTARRIAIAAGCIGSLMPLVGCGTSGDIDDAGNDAAAAASFSGSRAIPADSVQDVVTYSNAVARFTVLSEKALSEDASVRENGSGYVGRELQLKIDRVLWRGPDAMPPPEELTVIDFGWIVDDFKRTPVSEGDGVPRIDVGSTYVAPLVYLNCSWSITGPAAIPGQATGRSFKTEAPRAELARTLWASRDDDGLAMTLRSQKPDPLAAGLETLRPGDRAAAVAATRYKQPVPPPVDACR